MENFPIDIIWRIVHYVLETERWTYCVSACKHNANIPWNMKNRYLTQISYDNWKFVDQTRPYVTRSHIRDVTAGGYYRCPQLFLQRLRCVCKKWKRMIDRYTSRSHIGVTKNGHAIYGLKYQFETVIECWNKLIFSPL